MKLPRYLSVKEVAELLNISPKTVYKKLDIIPGYFNLGGMHFFDEEELISGLKKLAAAPLKSPSRELHLLVDKNGALK